MKPFTLPFPKALLAKLLLCMIFAGASEMAIAENAEPAANSAAFASVPSPAAIIAAMPKNLPRAKGPGLDEAIAAARASVAACTAKGAKVSVLVADSVGEPVVLLSGDGAGVRSQLIARTKVAIAVRYRMPSGEVEVRSKTEPQFLAEAQADPNIGVLRGGGFPVVRDGYMIGAVAVSGASLTGPIGLDEECAMVALAILERR